MQPPDRAREPTLTLAYVVVLGLLVALLRVAPYFIDWGGIWNLMPVGALALFAGSRLRSRRAWLVPLAIMFVADLLLVYPLAKLGYPSFSLIRTPIIYLSFLAYVGLGRLVPQDESSPPVIGGAALLGSVQFFVLTNFASWLVDVNSPAPLYTANAAGLLDAYVQGIPFYRSTLTSDLICSAVIFAGHAALAWAFRGERPRAAESARATWRIVAAWRPRGDQVVRHDEVRR